MNEEQVLVECAHNGEMGAFRELVERYKKKVYYLSFDLTGNHHDAEDLSQEVFIKAYRSLKNFRGDAKLNSWLYRINRNHDLQPDLQFPNLQRCKLIWITHFLFF